jgi:hypothetical protein
MDDPLDDDLKNRIRQVFDNYHDEHADEGWQLLREKYPEKARRSPVLWLWWGSAAAVLLVFLGILWFSKKPEKENKLVGNKPGINHPIVKSIEPQKNSNTIIDKSNNANDASADSVIKSLQTQKLAENQLLARRSHKTNIAKTNKPSASIETSNAIANNYSTANKRAVSDDKPLTDNKQNIAAINPAKTNEKQAGSITQSGKTGKVDSSANAAAQSMAAAKPNSGVNMLDQSKQPNKTVFANNEVPKNKKEQGYRGRAISFGVYAATYVNYASKSNNQINEGIGISSDIRLSRKLNLSTGVAIGQNSLNYNGQLPPEQSKLLSATNSSANNPAANNKTSALAAPAYSANSFFAATPSIKNYTASLVGLEVPINLKYHFNPEKSATFVSIGVSSGTFINERYTSTYSYSTPFASNLSQTTDRSLQQKFNSFYFAKTLNFSFGTGYRISGNDLIIEPFLKYPIDGLGSQQIKFGSGGVNLKFNFQGKRR